MSTTTFSKIKQVECPDCGSMIRPSNMRRHQLAHHLPKGERTVYGTAWRSPERPIRSGNGKDRRYDEHVPRGIGPHRFRIYRLRNGDLELLATTAGPALMGHALIRLHANHQFVGDDSVGVLDTAEEPGHWIVSPYTLGRKPVSGNGKT